MDIYTIKTTFALVYTCIDGVLTFYTSSEQVPKEHADQVTCWESRIDIPLVNAGIEPTNRLHIGQLAELENATSLILDEAKGLSKRIRDVKSTLGD